MTALSPAPHSVFVPVNAFLSSASFETSAIATKRAENSLASFASASTLPLAVSASTR